MEEINKLSLEVSLLATSKCEKRNVPASCVPTVLLASLQTAIVANCLIVLEEYGREDCNAFFKNMNDQIKVMGEEINEYLNEEIKNFNKESKR